jgi:hypothetical protein
MIRPSKIRKSQRTQGDEWPASNTAIPPSITTAPANSRQEPQRQHLPHDGAFAELF